MAMSSASAAMRGAKPQPRHQRVEGGPKCRVLRRQNQALAPQKLLEARAAHAGRCPDQAHRLFTDLVDEPRIVHLARGRHIRQHHVERQRIEFAQEFCLAAGAQHHLDVLSHDQRAQELDLEIARQGGERPHPQGAPRAALLLHHGGEVVRRAEDGIGMVERDAPGLGQDEAAPATLEQVMAKGRLESPDLGREGRLRQVEPPGRAGEGALCRYGTEQFQVVQVHEYSIKQNDQSQNM
jgi:hypothetical protein